MRLINIPETDLSEDEKKTVAGSWNNNALPSKIKDFLFKFNTNKLPINTRLLHMVQGTETNRACTFCTVSKDLPTPEETFAHLFWDCPHTRKHINSYFDNFFPELRNQTENVKKTFWFTGCGGNTVEMHNISRIVHLYSIWDLHTKRKIVSWATLKINTDHETSRIINSSHRLKHAINNNNFAIYRYWHERQQ